MADITNTTVHAGHTITLKIDGKVVGRAQSISGRRSFGQEAQHEIGDIMPKEHTPLRFEGSVTLEKYKVRKKSLVELGLAKYGIGILNMNVIDIEVTDKFTGDVVIIYRGCSLQDQSEDFRANAIAGESATWVFLSTDGGKPETAF